MNRLTILGGLNDDFLFALLAQKNELGSLAIIELIGRYKRMKTVLKFPVAQVYYCLYLLTSHTEEEAQRILADAKNIHDALKQRHPFISNANDLPFITHLCLNSNNEPNLWISRIEEIYNHLVKLGFTQCNGLLAASINLSNMEYTPKEVGERLLALKDQMKQLKLPFKADIYELFPLVLLQDKMKSYDLDRVKMAYDEVSRKRSVKWLSKKERLLIAINMLWLDFNQLNSYDQPSDALFCLMERHQIVHYLKVTQMNNAAATM